MIVHKELTPTAVLLVPTINAKAPAFPNANGKFMILWNGKL